jgi:hypothetical protein
MIARHTFRLQISESVAEAYDGLQAAVARDGAASLEELQGAVEYLLDKVKAAHDLNAFTVRLIPRARLAGSHRGERCPRQEKSASLGNGKKTFWY